MPDIELSFAKLFEHSTDAFATESPDVAPSLENVDNYWSHVFVVAYHVPHSAKY